MIELERAFFDEMKVGFGLWGNPYVSVPTELAVMLGGLWIYDRAAPSERCETVSRRPAALAKRSAAA
jgi:hypothetical protein